MKPRFRSMNASSAMVAASLLTALTAVQSTQAANVTLTANDPVGTTSWNATGKWDSLAAPTSGNSYFTGAFQLRTPGTGGSYTFAGDSLTINGGGGNVMLKGGGYNTLSANWILNGGYFRSGSGSTDTLDIAGTLAVTSNGGEVRADQSPMVVSATTTLNGSLNYNASSYAITQSGGISGSGSIVKTGNQTLNLSGTNTMSGSITVSSGTGVTLITGDYSGFTGTYTHNSASSNTQFNSASSGSQNAAYSISAGELIMAANGDYTVKFGSLASTGGNIRGGNSATGTTTLEIGNLGTSTSIAGNVNNGATKVIALTKVGSGSLTLNGTNNYTGATNVSAGTLFVSGALGDTAVSVASGATIGAGDESGSIGGSLFLAAGATLDVSNGLLTVATGKTVSFGGFDFDDIDGFDVYAAAVGVYTMIDGSFTLDSTNISHFGESNALILGNGNKAWFSEGSLNVNVAAVPEPGAVLLGSLGLIALMRRRRC